jgi:hypothetical protein
MTKMSKFNARIHERAAYLPDRIRYHIASALESVVEAAEIAQCAYDTAVAAPSTPATPDRIIELLRVESIRANDHFEEVLNIACILAAEINSDIESETPTDAAVIKPTSAALNFRDVAPHQYKLRDLIRAELEISVIGKIIARSNVIAVCELTEGCYLFDTAGNPATLVKKDTKFLGIVDDTGKITPMIPYNLDYEEVLFVGVSRGENASYKYTPKADGNIGYCLPNSELSSEGITGIDSTQNGYFVKRAAEWIKKRTVQWSELPMLKPKYRVIRYEQSYRILVAAPWDFGIEALKKRALGGERLDVRYEIEKVLLGHQTPSVVSGAGVGFTHVLESQLKMFSITDIMARSE